MANEIIRPTLLPPRANPVASEVVPSDNGGQVAGVTWKDGVNAGRPVASQAEAVAGTDASKSMSALTTKQSIASEIGATIASKAQGDLAASAVQLEDLASVATSGEYADLEGKPSLGSMASQDTTEWSPIGRAMPSGGVPGQSLVKLTETDFDTGWVTSEAATAVSYGPQSLSPAQKGQARANIGAGVMAGFRNKLINGAFEIWQRGTSQNSVGYGSADQWRLAAAGNQGAISRIALDGVASASIPGEPRYAARLSAATVLTADTRLVQHVESVRTLVGQTGTLSGHIRGSTDQTVLVEVFQVFGTGGSPSATVPVGGQTITLAPGFTRFDIVMDFPSVAGKTFGSNDDDFLIVRFTLPSGTASGRFFDLARVSLVEGDATAEEDPFSPRHPQQELALCQRYCFVPTRAAIPGQFATGFVRNPNAVRAVVRHPVRMYKVPTAIIANPTTGFAVHSGGASSTPTGLVANPNEDLTLFETVSTGLTPGDGAHIVALTGTIILDAGT